MQTQKGSLLIEIMVSMALGVFLMYGALQVLVSTKKNALFRSAAAEVANNGRLAMDMIASDIRMAGYKGCAPANKIITTGVEFLANSYFSGALLNPNTGIRGWDYANDLAVPISEWTQTRSFNTSTYWSAGGATDPVDVGQDTINGNDFTLVRGSDTLRLWSIEPYVMSSTALSGSGITPVSGTMEGFPAGGGDRLLLLSDCEKALLLKATSFSAGVNGIVLGDLDTDAISPFYGTWAGQVVMLNMVQYSLEIPSGRTRPSLYRREMGADGNFKNKVEIMPGVISMQFKYGLHPYGNLEVIKYLNATQMTDWDDAFSVKIWMLVESERDNVLSDSQTVNFYDNSYDFGDRRLRREFTTTVTLRNRVLGDN